MSRVEHRLGIGNAAGESPMWVPEEGALYWVDCEGDQLFRLEAGTGKHQVIPAALPVTAICRRAKGGWIAATRKGLAFWALERGHPGRPDGEAGKMPALQGRFEFIVDPEEGHADHRCNDAAVDRQGRFWVGTMNQKDLNAPTGSLWRLDPDLKLHRIDTGFAVPNGIAFAPDDRTMYVTDMFHGRIVAYDFDPKSGTVSRRRDFAVLPKDAGLPDGLIVDAQGYVWSAHWGGWRVTRYAPDGRIDREIRLPVANITCMAFGGAQLDELYITTASAFLGDDDRRRQPQAGDLFSVKPGVRGLPEPRFAG
mgnify:CR=1 FL=1